MQQKSSKKRSKLRPQGEGKYTYQQTGRYFAQIGEGLESLAERELMELGVTEVKPGFRGLYFWASHEALYRITYHTRLIQKIIAPLTFLDCHSTKYLHQRAMAIEWTDFLSLDTTFAIVANVANSNIRHSKYAALCLKDAIADYFMAKFDKRPNVDTDNPDVWFNLYIHNNRAVIGLEVSGGSLHKRHYRIVGHEAPMQETIAAGIIRYSGWQGEGPLVDPMCGSGTLLCEALMHTCRIPAAYLRERFGFEALPDYQPQLWAKVKREAEAAMRPLPEDLICGSDISVKALEATEANLSALPYGDLVKLRAIDFRNIKDLSNATIVCNPPYGLRLQKKEGMEAFCKDLGDFLKQRCLNSSAYLYFGDRELIKHLGLRPSWKKPIASGGLDGRLVKVKVFGKQDSDDGPEEKKRG